MYSKLYIYTFGFLFYIKLHLFQYTYEIVFIVTIGLSSSRERNPDLRNVFIVIIVFFVLFCLVV